MLRLGIAAKVTGSTLLFNLSLFDCYSSVIAIGGMFEPDMSPKEILSGLFNLVSLKLLKLYLKVWLWLILIRAEKVPHVGVDVWDYIKTCTFNRVFIYLFFWLLLLFFIIITVILCLVSIIVFNTMVITIIIIFIIIIYHQHWLVLLVYHYHCYCYSFPNWHCHYCYQFHFHVIIVILIVFIIINSWF